MIDYIFESLSSIRVALGGSGALFVLAIGLAVTAMVSVVFYLGSIATDPIRRRVRNTGDTEGGTNRRASNFERSVAPIRNYIVPTSMKELAQIRRRLIHAGFRSREAVTVFYATKLFLAISLGLLGALVSYALPQSTVVTVLAAVAFGVMFGLLAPSYFLDKRVIRRQTEIVNAFPDVLDMVVACSEAGLGLNDSIQRVSRETTMMFPVLSEELELVNSQIRAGVERTEALKALAERTGVEAIEGFVAMIVQSVRFGTSIAETLRIFSEEFRDRRMQRAEEQAAKVATKLIFPLVLCIFPSFFVVAIGPAAIRLMKVFQSLNDSLAS